MSRTLAELIDSITTDCPTRDQVRLSIASGPYRVTLYAPRDTPQARSDLLKALDDRVRASLVIEHADDGRVTYVLPDATGKEQRATAVIVPGMSLGRWDEQLLLARQTVALAVLRSYDS